MHGLLGTWGECELVGRNGGKDGYWHDPRLATTYGTGSSSDSGLYTKAQFGCVQHEKKTTEEGGDAVF